MTNTNKQPKALPIRGVNFVVDPDFPYTALEDCSYQLEMLGDFLAAGGENISLSDRGTCGLLNMLRAITDTLDRVHELEWKHHHQSADAGVIDAAPATGPVSAAPAPRLTERHPPTMRQQSVV